MLMQISRRHLLSLAASLAPFAGAHSAPQWRIATAYPEDTHHTQNLQWYVQKLAQAGTGAPAMQVHAGGKLVKPAEIFEAVRSGRVEAGEVIMSSLEKENPLFGLDSIPFLVRNFE